MDDLCYLRTITYGDKREVVPMPLFVAKFVKKPKNRIWIFAH